MLKRLSCFERSATKTALGAACAFLSLGAPCWAQTPAPSAADVSMARSLGVEGVQLADAGNCAAAIDKLTRAESLYHAPTILGRLGECQVTTGKIVLGTETLERVVREPLAPHAPAAFAAAHARAQKALDAALPRIAKLHVHVDPSTAPGLQVKLDDEVLPAAALDVDRPTDPGAHQLDVTATGYAEVRTSVTLAEGASQTVPIQLAPVAAPVAAIAPVGAGVTAITPASTAPVATTPDQGPAPLAPSPATPPPDQGGSSGSGTRTAGFVLLGVGGAGLAVGTIFGVLALSSKSTVDDECGNHKSTCPASAQSNIDSMKTRGTIATIGFIGGAALAATGGVLVFVGGRSPSADSGTHASVFSPRVAAFIGPASAGLAGDF
jgi:hypothetical protein